jgi:hypothetical protein
MKHISLSVLLLLALGGLSCKDSSTDANSNELTIIPPTDAISLFVGQSQDVFFSLSSPISDTSAPVLDMAEPQYFTLFALQYFGDSKNQLYFTVQGRQLTAGTVTQQVKIRIGDKSGSFNLKASVNDFYYIKQYETNVIDTLILRKGDSALVQITCKDQNNRVTSYNSLKSFAYGWSITQYFVPDKFTVINDQRDTTSYYFKFNVYPNIVSTSKDTGTAFNFRISNKELRIPIKFEY